ncbi:MAG: hypothetical protein GYA31_00045 [Parcubacteria group bacterium]|nr:hypothetical protein [Parcubacteria group bacterium]
MSITKKNQKSIIIIIILIIILTLIKLVFQFNLNKNSSFPLTDIKLGNINLKSKQVLYTNNFTKGNEFLVSFNNIATSTSLKVILWGGDDFKAATLSDSVIQSGFNELCCFEVPKTPGHYNLKFVIANQEQSIPLEVKEQTIEYKDYIIRGVGVIPYPNWPVLDSGLLTNLLTDVFSYSSKDLAKGISILLAVEDDNGAQFSLSRRVVSNYPNMPFGNLVATIEENENKALIKAGIIDDYEILQKQYGDQEIYLEIRNISQGKSYLIFNKTILEKNLFNQRILLSASLTCPEKLVDFYQPIADYILSKFGS